MKKEFEVISKIIQNNKRVLDIGCGDGTLMEYLKTHQQNDVRGLEPQKNLVQKCISKGLSVIEGDAEKDQQPEDLAGPCFGKLCDLGHGSSRKAGTKKSRHRPGHVPGRCDIGSRV